MTPTRHAIDWFEIPVSDMDRAAAFYEALLATTIRRERIEPHALGVIKYDASAVGGCLIQGDDVPAPSTAGTLVYLNAGPSLDTVLARVEAAGGRITTPKVTLPGDMGCFAHITDSEGNRVGLHAPA
jgi:predicted enzyme related to lactoylglutathione lyase